MTLDIFRLWHTSAALSITFSIRVLQVAPSFHFRGIPHVRGGGVSVLGLVSKTGCVKIYNWRHLQFFKKLISKKQSSLLEIIVCIGVSNPPQKHRPPLSCQAPLKSANCPSPPFLGNPPPYILVFIKPPPSKTQIFRWTPIILKLFILHPILPFKSN